MARLIDDTGSKLLETAKVLFGHAEFSAELATEIRRNGGADRAVQALLREFQRDESSVPSSFPIWKTIQIGGKTAAELIAEMKSKGFKIGDWARDMMGQEAFTTLTESVELKLVRVTVRQLGLCDGATTQEIWDRALGLKLQLCPAEVGPHLRLQHPDQPKDEWVRIAMEQIVGSDGDPSVFDVGHDGDGRWLGSDVAHPERGWGAEDAFPFVLPRA